MLNLMKWIIILLLIYYPLNYIYINYLTAFRFEKFSNYEQFNEYLDQRFLNKDAKEMVAVLEKAGAKCHFNSTPDWKTWEKVPMGSSSSYWCEYNSGMLGINSWKEYRASFISDREGRILSIVVGVHGVVI